MLWPFEIGNGELARDTVGIEAGGVVDGDAADIDRASDSVEHHRMVFAVGWVHSPRCLRIEKLAVVDREIRRVFHVHANTAGMPDDAIAHRAARTAIDGDVSGDVLTFDHLVVGAHRDRAGRHRL